MQLIVLVDNMVASYLDPGSISHLYYANRLFQFPFALVGVAVGTVVLPESSRHVVEKNGDRVFDTARQSLGLMSFLMIPSAFGLWLIGYPLLGVLFRRGAFSFRDQRITYAVLVFSLFGLFAYGCLRIFISICYSYEDTKGPVLAALLALLTNGSLNIFFVLLWAHFLPGWIEYRVAALTLAGSISVWLQVFFLRYWLSRYLPAGWLFPWGKVIRHLLFALLMVGFAAPLLLFNFGELLTVFLVVISGALFYFLLAHLCGETYPYRIWFRIKERFSEKQDQEVIK